MELNTTFREDLSLSLISGISPIDISNDQESFNLFDKFFDSEDDNSTHVEPEKDEGGEPEKDEGEEGCPSDSASTQPC